MSELRKTYPGGLFFLTVVGWVDVFNRPRYVDILTDSLLYCQQHKGLELYAYVIMSSHVHLIAARTEGNLSDVLRDLKAYTARQLLKSVAENEHESRREWMMRLFAYYARPHRQNEQYMFWQKTTHPIALFTPAVLHQKLRYIHLNPVEAGLVTAPEHYSWSSACPSGPLQTLPL
ncbi:transposase [Hymenobacter busanensis]|uniref:Transposase n=1 Tax=Hymenobacter busanensis TaxID=2607656 RepID=A0A7L4ZVX6_9BACT|nr:transposase [Hymenobacter busanensis]KAA9332068.1 transposase [Hymenobacter busanensis]QHJ07594.1 transposase [Hymenobacter busanensis]